MTGQHIDALRKQLRLSIKDFSSRLAIDAADYALLMGNNNIGQLSLSARNILCSIIAITPAERIREGMIFWDKKIFDVLNTVKSYETKSFKIFAPVYKFIDMILYEKSDLPFQKCWGHPFYPTVSADGSVLVCCHALNNLLDNNNTGVYGQITENVRFADIWAKDARWKEGDGIHIGSCPCNCKLSEVNKILETVYGGKTMHKNFI